jgi:AcrR family transcriptional regulator
VTAARTARERARQDLVEAILAAARRQLAEVGAPALSLRAVARDLGLASSALYRYFPSRDALLTALLVEGFDAVGATAEQADARAVAAGAEPGARWLAVCRGVRGWALAHPHQWSLLYGSPVPGYAAPRDTVEPATRLSRVMAGVVLAAVQSGALVPPARPLPGSRLVTPAVVEIAGGAPPPPYDDVLERSLLLVVALVGAVSFELFGHLVGALTDDAAGFDALMAVAGDGVGLVLPRG